MRMKWEVPALPAGRSWPGEGDGRRCRRRSRSPPVPSSRNITSRLSLHVYNITIACYLLSSSPHVGAVGRLERSENTSGVLPGFGGYRQESVVFTPSWTLIVQAMYVPRMVRPEISEEVIQQVEELTAGEFNVSDEKVSFEDRVRILAQNYQALRDDPSKMFSGR